MYLIAIHHVALTLKEHLRMLGEMITDYPQLLQSSQVENFHSSHIFYLNFSLFRKPFQTCYILCLCLVLLTMGSPLISNFFISKFYLI